MIPFQTRIWIFLTVWLVSAYLFCCWFEEEFLHPLRYQWIAKSSLWEPFLGIIHPQIFIEWWLCAKHCSRHCAQLLQFLCNSMDCSPPGASVHRILQARILEWAAISFSRADKQLMGWIRNAGSVSSDDSCPDILGAVLTTNVLELITELKIKKPGFELQICL